MKILVTGGAGFIGSHLCKQLLANENEVVVIDNLNDYYNPEIKKENIRYILNKNFKFYKGDITSLNSIKTIFETEGINKVVHLAARAGVRPSMEQPELYQQTNIGGTLNLLELSKKYGVEKFIFASSSSVYGERHKVPFSEKDRTDNPLSVYAATKKAGELLCNVYSDKLSSICLRFFTVYGPRGRPDMAPYKFIKAINNEDPLELYGDGTSLRDYTFVDDIVEGILSALDYKNSDYEIINLGSSNPIKLNDFIHTIEKVVGKKGNIIYTPKKKAMFLKLMLIYLKQIGY